MSSAEILEKIEAVRQELNELGETKSLLDSEIVRFSQQLDHLLNMYQKLVKPKET